TMTVAKRDSLTHAAFHGGVRALNLQICNADIRIGAAVGRLRANVFKGLEDSPAGARWLDDYRVPSRTYNGRSRLQKDSPFPQQLRCQSICARTEAQGMTRIDR